MDPRFPQVAGISVSPGILPVLAFQFPQSRDYHESTIKCMFVLPEQIFRIRYSAVPGLYSLPALFLFLPLVSWGGGRAWVPPGHSFATLPCSMTSVLFSNFVQFGVVFFPVALSGLVVLIIF